MADVERLFDKFQPDYYRLSIIPDRQKRTFRGHTVVSGRIDSNQGSLLLHSKDLKISKVKVNGRACKFVENPIEELLQIKLPTGLKTGDLTVDIRYQGRIADSLNGLYRCKGRDGATILTTQFESHYARQVFPCIDEPEAKAVFKLSLTTPAGESVLSNTLPITTEAADGLVNTTFADTPKMSTYLLAFVAGRLKKTEAISKDGVLVRAWSTHDKAKFTDFALDVAVKSLDFYNDYFELPYPLTKCDIVAVPDFAAGAMENWGLLTFRETAMLVDPVNTSLITKQHIAAVIAHEMAHQWFGNLVTMKWWDDLWLNEGFASWIEYLAVDKIFPEWHIWTHFVATDQDVALREDALINSHPIQVHISHPDEIHSVFDNISYSKGASIIHMLHQYLGSNDFRLGLVHYLSKHRYGNTVTNDLWAALEEVSHKPVKSFMSAWTTQTGYPYVSITPKKDKLEFIQKRFLINGSSPKRSETWPIPLLTTQIKCQLIKTAKQSLKMPADLKDLVVNQGQSGFYITKYWPEHYQRLTELASQNKLDETDRLRLVTDSLALTIAGHMKLTDFLELLTNYSNESIAPVWDCLNIALGEIKRAMGEATWQQLKSLALQISSSQVKRLGWQEKAGESFNDLQLRPLVLGMAASGDSPEIYNEALKQFKSAKSVSDLPPDLRLMILSLVARHGGKTEFTKTLRFFKATDSPEDKVLLTRALTNFRNPKEYRLAIQLIKSDYVRSQDTVYWLAYGLANPVSRPEIWQWIKDNWQWLKDRLGGDISFTMIPIYVARFQNDLTFLDDYNQFFKSVYQPGLARSIKQGRETIRLMAAWKSRDEQSLLRWLHDHDAKQG